MKRTDNGRSITTVAVLFCSLLPILFVRDGDCYPTTSSSDRLQNLESTNQKLLFPSHLKSSLSSPSSLESYWVMTGANQRRTSKLEIPKPPVNSTSKPSSHQPPRNFHKLWSVDKIFSESSAPIIGPGDITYVAYKDSLIAIVCVDEYLHSSPNPLKEIAGSSLFFLPICSLNRVKGSFVGTPI